jgi:5'-nucleotidase
MPLLLVTNDDGVHAPGLAALADALGELGEVWVVAPEREQSACGHALTLHRPLRTHRWDERRFAVNGTPSDCVNLGVLGFLPERPVLIASGINHGSNLGDDVTYSGTVSAAMEGTLLGVPSIAVSLMEGGDVAEAARVARQIAMRVLVEGLAPKTLLNVNVPAGTVRGIRLTRLGHRVYSEKIVEQTDPRGRTHYWIGAGPPEWEALEGTDMGAVHEGYVAVTPLHMDLTNHRALAVMADWQSALNAGARRPASARLAAAPAPAPPAKGKTGKAPRR